MSEPSATRRVRVSPRRLLWAAVLVVVALLAVVLWAQRRESEEEARVEAVARYIREVNGVQRGLAVELDRVSRTYRGFGESAANAREAVDELEAAAGTIATLHREIVALDPPPEAEALHAEIVELTALEQELAEEVLAIGRTLPIIAAESRKLAAAARRLLRGLRQAESLSAQAEAFARYASDLEGVARRFRALNTPAVLAPSVRAEAKRLGTLAGLAKQTRNALVREQPADARRLSDRLAKAASQSPVVGESQEEAIQAYGRRIRAIRDQERAVTSERERLARALA